MISVQSLINKELERKEEKREIKSWYCSGLGSCLTGRYLERLGAKPDTEFDERTLRVFSAGKHFEDWVVDLIKKQDPTIETQVKMYSEELNLSGYLDFIITDKETNKQIIYELKTKNSMAFWYMEKSGKPMRQHEMQLWAYLYLKKIEEGRLLYIEKDTLTTSEYVVQLQDKGLEEEVMYELELLNTAWKNKIPPIPVLDKKDWRYKYCRWHKQCLKTISNPTTDK